jgi:serine/threonine protein kinase
VNEDFPVLAGFRAGSLVAGYRLEVQIGAGGMAVVFRARDERLGRAVALKILSPALAADAGFRRRFIAESRAAAVVDDPHIIPVFEAGESGGVLFIAMRFVAGGDLRGVLDREGPMPPGRAAAFISPVASALDAAHRAGLVHRDVKPANILVDARQDRPDHVYLSDFGVSKGAASSVSVTGTGQFLGTPDYSAPEQVQGRPVDGRADQYALACLAFQLLAGSAPFERDHGMAVLLAHLSEPPPSLAQRRPDLPAAADFVLGRAMAKAPAQRYGSCQEFADALRDALGVPPYASPGQTPVPSHPPTAISAPRGQANSADVTQAASDRATSQLPVASARTGPAAGRFRSFRLRAAVGLAALLAVGAGLTAYALSGGGAGTQRPDRIATLTFPGGTNSPVYAMVFSPSGTTLAVSSNNGSTYLWDVATRTITASFTDPKSKGVYWAAFSPDGTTLAAGDGNGHTYLWDLATRTIIATLTDPKSAGVAAEAFSPGGTTLAVGDFNGRTYLWDLATRTIAATLADPKSEGVVSLAFSPGGTTLAAGDYNGSTYLWDMATRTITAALASPKGKGVDVAFSPDGTALAAGTLDGSTYLWDLATRTVTATLTDPKSKGVNVVAFNANGTALVTGDSNGSTYLWDLATRTITATLADPKSKGVFWAAFTPDGTTLAAGDYNGSTYLWKVGGASG